MCYICVYVQVSNMSIEYGNFLTIEEEGFQLEPDLSEEVSARPPGQWKQWFTSGGKCQYLTNKKKLLKQRKG